MGWIGPVTYRQYRTWQYWFKEQWSQPDRTDHYLMQIAAEVRRGRAKRPQQVKLDHLRLKFKEKATTTNTTGKTDVARAVRNKAMLDPDDPAVVAEKKRRAEISKAKWLSVADMGGKVKVRHVDQDGNELSAPAASNKRRGK